MADVKTKPVVDPKTLIGKDGVVDFDKLVAATGAEIIHFDRPIATFKLIPTNTVVGYLVADTWLQKPKEQEQNEMFEVDEDDPHANEWPVFIVYLTHPCLAMDNGEKKTIEAGREVYLPKTAKLKELEAYLGKPEMYQFAVTGDGMMPRKNGPGAIAKFRHALLGTKVRTGHFLALGGPPQVAQLGPSSVTASNGAQQVGIPQGVASVPATA